MDQNENEKWIEQLKLSIGHSSLEQFYQVGCKIGNGKFGTVKAAKHNSSGTPSAVKVIKKNAMNK